MDIIDISAFLYPSRKAIVLAIIAGLTVSELHHLGRPHIELLTHVDYVSSLTSTAAASGTVHHAYDVSAGIGPFIASPPPAPSGNGSDGPTGRAAPRRGAAVAGAERGVARRIQGRNPALRWWARF